jgi:hypothetical protein
MTERVTAQCSRWDLACDTLQILAELAADYDDDGVDVFFLNSKHSLKVGGTSLRFEEVNP